MDKDAELKRYKLEYIKNSDLRDRLQQEVWRLDKLLEFYRLEIDTLTFDCPCVNFGKDIGVFTNADLESKNLNCLGIGACTIATNFTARRNCLICRGTGKQ